MLLAAAYAQPAPKLNAVSREWLQRGVSTEITLTGEYLGSSKQILAITGVGSHGVKGEFIPAATSGVAVESSGAGISAVTRPDNKSLRVRIQVDPAAALTDRELRLITEHGVSNPLTLRVSPWPEADAAQNHSRDQAQGISLPVAVSGTVSTPAESHFYRFRGKKDEQVILEVHAHRLGSKLDSSLAIFDSSGKELGRSEDVVGLDSALEFSIPTDGDYVVELRDFRYQGAADYKYRLIAGAIPYVRKAFPFGGQRGKTVEVQLQGINLGDSGKMLLHLAADATAGRQDIRTVTSLGLSNPFSFDVSDLPSVDESEPNSAIDQADRIGVPAAINGRINSARDYDAFKFSASKDQRIIFEVQAFRFGSPLDALLILTDHAGKTLLRNDDAVGSDARMEYTFKEAGDYVIILEDLLNRGGPDFGYRLTAGIPQPDFSVAVLQDAPRVRQGGRIPIRCEVSRMNGFNEPVRITCEELPAGIHAEPLVLSPESGSGFLVLNASADAPQGSFPLKVRAAAGDRKKEASALAGDKAVEAAFVTVLEAAPFSITPATLMSSIEQSQAGMIEVLVERRADFSGEIKITPEGFSVGRDPITKSFEFQALTLKAGETRGKLSLKAKTDSEVAIRHLILRGEAEVNGHTVAGYSPLIPVGTVQIPYVLSTSLKKLIVTALPPDSSSAASEAVFTVKAERRLDFSGEIDLKIDGLPEGIKVSELKIPAEGTEATVKLVAGEGAPVGKEVPLTITGAGTHRDRIYRFSAPAITLTINAPETDEKKDAKLANTAP